MTNKGELPENFQSYMSDRWTSEWKPLLNTDFSAASVPEMTTHRLVPQQYFLNILPCTNICFYRQNPAQSDFFISTVKNILAWTNSRHLAMLPLVSLPNDPDLGSASHWLNQISHATQPIRSTTQIWVVTCHQYGISALVSDVMWWGNQW